MRADLARVRQAVTVRSGSVAERARVAWGRRHRRVLVLGDSHAGVFRHASWRAVPLRFDVLAIGAATLTGLDNLDSASGARRKFDAALTSAGTPGRSPEAVVTLMGEVDCGFLFWKRHERSGAPLVGLLEEAVERYQRFVLRAQATAPVVVLSAPLPTLAESSAIGDYAGQRREIRATRTERTKLVRDLNHRCEQLCRAAGAAFVDLDTDSIGPDGQVSPLLIGADPSDHHYDQVVYSRLLQRRLAPVLGYRFAGSPFSTPESAI